MVYIGIIIFGVGMILWLSMFKFGLKNNTTYSDAEFDRVNKREKYLGVASIVSSAVGLLIITFALLFA